MATTPYFVFSPSTVLSALGLLRGPDPTTPTPREDWRTATVDAIIPALNEERHIVFCLASLLKQTLRPRRIMIVDDGSTDRTVAIAEAFCSFHGIDLVTIRRRKPIGKTPTIKRQARELDSDVEFILDADTILESPNYIERTVQELYQAVGIASACGTILPLRKKDRKVCADDEATRRFLAESSSSQIRVSDGRLHDLASGVTNLYREVLYLFLQRFVYRGQMVFFGTTINPVGCAVAYRRKYVQRLFDEFSPLLGDDLTNSEDIFIGLAMLDEGYRNVHLTDVCARTVEPEVQRLPRQIYLWSSAFLQSCYYFDALLKSPFKAFKRRWQRRGPWRRSGEPISQPRPVQLPIRGAAMLRRPMLATSAGTGAGTQSPVPAGMRFSAVINNGVVDYAPRSEGPLVRGEDRRVVGEPYRQAFGRERTETYGRPAGWMLMMSAIEKVFFPTSLVVMALLRNWYGLTLTVCIETLVGLTVLAIVMKGRRLEYVAKGLAVAPLRYALIAFELVTLGRFATDIWFINNRKWRK